VIFVDTGAWFARYVADDVDHALAVAWFSSLPDRLITTDYRLCRRRTLNAAQGAWSREYRICRRRNTFGEQVCPLEYVQSGDIEKAWAIFSQHCDKGWSFTDCTSLAVMQKLNISTACAFDIHFRQFGSIQIVP